MTFMPLEAEERSRHREVRWVSPEGKLSLEKMTSEDACLTQVQCIVAGKTPNLRDLYFAIRTPFNLANFAPELDSGKEIWRGTNLQRMPFNGWSMGWLLEHTSEGWEISLVKDG